MSDQGNESHIYPQPEGRGCWKFEYINSFIEILTDDRNTLKHQTSIEKGNVAIFVEMMSIRRVGNWIKLSRSLLLGWKSNVKHKLQLYTPPDSGVQDSKEIAKLNFPRLFYFLNKVVINIWRRASFIFKRQECRYFIFFLCNV